MKRVKQVIEKQSPRLLLCAILCFTCLISTAAAQDKLQFYSSVEAARESLQPDDPAKPIVLYFGASWCAPCQKMKSVTFENLKEEEKAKNFLWVKYDIDDSPEMASNFRVISVPTMIVLDSQENPIGAAGGFMTTEKLLTFVCETVKNPAAMPPSIEEIAEGIADADVSELNDAVDLLIRELASPNRTDRQQMLSIVKEHKRSIQPRLIEWLEDTELKMRAAASLAISSTYGIRTDFDPFATPEIRKKQIAQIKSLLPPLD